MKTEYKLNIHGREMKILSECSQDHIHAIETLVTERIGQLGGGAGAAMSNAVILAALNLADELVRERDAHRALKEKIRTRSNALLQKLELKSFAA